VLSPPGQGGGLASERQPWRAGRKLAHRMGQRIENPLIDDVVTFLETSAETGGKRTLLKVELAPGGGNTPHYHKTYDEHFRVLKDRLNVRVDDAEQELQPGGEAAAPAGCLHRFRNTGAKRAVFNVELRPGHEGFEKSLRVGYALAVDGRTNAKSIPKNPLHTALLLEWSEARLPGTLGLLDRPLRLLARAARWRGVDRELESKYLDG
jgi:mannose-6-phosphate isomerase-like protein (cupin superfamily)